MRYLSSIVLAFIIHFPLYGQSNLVLDCEVSRLVIDGRGDSPTSRLALLHEINFRNNTIRQTAYGPGYSGPFLEITNRDYLEFDIFDSNGSRIMADLTSNVRSGNESYSMRLNLTINRYNGSMIMRITNSTGAEQTEVYGECEESSRRF
jgi:hypothetical protein